jgi:heme/copper-type cytochrome/quinol oxidase subunit 3
VTWAHHALLHGDREGLKKGLLLTVILGLIFTCVQAYEYATRFGFKRLDLRRDLLHGDRLPRRHVIIGTIFLIVCLLRLQARPFHAAAAFRLRIRRLVLAFRRRGLAVPVRRRLRLGSTVDP